MPVDDNRKNDYLDVMRNDIFLFTLGSILFLNTPLFSEEQVFGNYFQNLAFVNQHTDCTKDPDQVEQIMTIASQEKKKRRRMSLSRSDQIPKQRLAEETASYMEGYIQAMIDANYYELNVIVFVGSDRIVYLYNLPKDDRIKHSILAYVQDMPDVFAVREGEMNDSIKKKVEDRQGTIRRINGVWFPESTVLFPPIIANPREPIYSVAYRWFDKVLAKNLVAVSLGDIFPIFRWFDVFPAHGDLQIDIAACVWADFNMTPDHTPNGEWAELVNTDYLLSIPITYAFDKWAFRLRGYHISSHLGDEFIVNNPAVLRLNPSFEAIEFMATYQFTDGFRLYAGPGFVVHSDNSFPMDVFYAEFGFEWRFSGFRMHHHHLYGGPFLAADLQLWEVNNYRPSTTAQLGYEFSKLQGAGRKVRLFLEYHNGYSAGQFFTENAQYLAIRGSWGF